MIRRAGVGGVIGRLVGDNHGAVLLGDAVSIHSHSPPWWPTSITCFSLILLQHSSKVLFYTLL